MLASRAVSFSLWLRIAAPILFVSTSLLVGSPHPAGALEAQPSDDGQNVIILSGEFKASDDLREIEAALRAGTGGIVSFNSPGGNIYAAMEVGRLIRRLNLSTGQLRYQECASACSLAFLGGVLTLCGAGRDRSSQILVHPGHSDDHRGGRVGCPARHGRCDRLHLEMGADPGLLALAFSYDSSDIRYLSGSEMARFRVTTEPPPEDAASNPPAPQAPAQGAPKTDDELALADFEREVRKYGITLYETIKEELPDEYEAFAREMIAVTAAGGDEGYQKATALVAALRRKHAAQIQKAPDSVTSEILRLTVDLLKAVQQRESDALCAKVASQGGAALDPDDHFYQDFFDRGATATFRAIGAGLRNAASFREATDPTGQKSAKAIAEREINFSLPFRATKTPPATARQLSCFTRRCSRPRDQAAGGFAPIWLT